MGVVKVAVGMLGVAVGAHHRTIRVASLLALEIFLALVGQLDLAQALDQPALHAFAPLLRPPPQAQAS